MFTLIDPLSREKNKVLFSRLFETREGLLSGEKDAFDQETTSYIAYENPAWGMMGSCRLNTLNHSPASLFYRQKLPELSCYRTLEVSRISFHLPDGHWAQDCSDVFDQGIQEFYRGLYDVLISFVQTQDLEGLVTLSLEEDHPDLPFFGSWLFHQTHTLQTGEASYVIGEIALVPDLGAVA